MSVPLYRPPRAGGRDGGLAPPLVGGRMGGFAPPPAGRLGAFAPRLTSQLQHDTMSLSFRPSNKKGGTQDSHPDAASTLLAVEPRRLVLPATLHSLQLHAHVRKPVI